TSSGLPAGFFAGGSAAWAAEPARAAAPATAASFTTSRLFKLFIDVSFRRSVTAAQGFTRPSRRRAYRSIQARGGRASVMTLAGRLPSNEQAGGPTRGRRP